MMSKRPVLGVYLAYYEDYGVAGVNKFKRFLRKLDANAELIVACNGSVFDLLHDYPAHVIRGNNVLREFSGWESGLDYARSIGVDLDKHLLIFANDTFCYHNSFGPISRFAFARAFKQLMNSPQVAGLAGEVWTFGGVYEVDGFTADRWVATYLFAISGETVKKIGSICPDPPIERFHALDSDQLQFSGILSPNLASHLIRWLSGGTSASWKNHAKADISGLERLRGKANAIICEKYLSAKVIFIGGLLIDVFESRWIRQFRRFENIYARIEKKLLRK